MSIKHRELCNGNMHVVTMKDLQKRVVVKAPNNSIVGFFIESDIRREGHRHNAHSSDHEGRRGIPHDGTEATAIRGQNASCGSETRRCVPENE
jgi:hypothetical protein